jgi:hypothetical protein
MTLKYLLKRSRQELKALKEVAGDTVKFLESNQSLITDWFAKVRVVCPMYKQTVLASTNMLSQ